MSSIKKLAGQTAVYGLSSILARAINFLLVPFYTYYMSAHAFGVLAEYMVYIAFLMVVLTFGMETTYFRYAQDTEEEPKVFSQLMTYVSVFSLAITLLILFFSSNISQLLAATGSVLYVQLMAIILFLDAISALPFARLRNQNKGLYFVLVKITSILLNVILNVLLVWYIPIHLKINILNVFGFGLDLKNQVASILIANVLANSVYVFFFAKDLMTIGKHWSKKHLRPVLQYAYPVMILGLAGLVNELIDRLMLKKYLPTDFYSKEGINAIEAMGVYAANYKFAIFITLAIQAYRYAAEPFFFKTGKEKNSSQTFAQLMTLFALVLLLAATTITIFRQEIGFLILRNEVFRTGINIVPILLLANVCVGIYYNLSAWYKLTDKTIFGTWIGIGGAVITLIINYILIPIYGYMGCAIATLVCYASMMFASYFLGQKYYPIPYQTKKIVLYFAISILLMLVSIFCIEQLAFAIAYKIGLLLLILIGVYKIEFSKLVTKAKNV